MRPNVEAILARAEAAHRQLGHIEAAALARYALELEESIESDHATNPRAISTDPPCPCPICTAVRARSRPERPGPPGGLQALTDAMCRGDFIPKNAPNDRRDTPKRQPPDPPEPPEGPQEHAG